MNKNIVVLLIAISALSFFSFKNSKYILGDNDQVVITQFGKVVADVTVPGEHYKIPFIQKAHYFKKNYFSSESAQEIPTKDKKFVRVENKSFYKISDPVAFYKNINSYDLAMDFVFKHTGLAEREIVTSLTLSEIVGSSKVKQVMKGVECNPVIQYQILKTARNSMSAAMVGIELSNIEAKITHPINAEKP